MPTLPIERIVFPADMTGVENGKLPDYLLAACGLGTFKMHHLAARAMKALVDAATKAGFNVSATGTLRSYERQRQMFDGTLPQNRTRYEGRYIPERLWHTVGQATLDHGDVRTWQGQRWKRRLGTAAAAVPGTSIHGYGFAVDFTYPTAQFLNWLLAHADEFGYSWELQAEPWHLRYVKGDAIPQAVLDYEASISGTPVTPPAPLPPPPIFPTLPPFIPEQAKWGLMPLVPHIERPNLDLGSGFGTGPDRDWVRYVQGVLALKCGYSTWITPHGLYDELTKAAVAQVQGNAYVNLYPDGKVNLDDWNWIDAAAAA